MFKTHFGNRLSLTDDMIITYLTSGQFTSSRMTYNTF